MSNGTVRWFNRTIGAGFIRTDAGENVLYLNNTITEFDPQGIQEGMRVSLDIQESRDGFGLTALHPVCGHHHRRHILDRPRNTPMKHPMQTPKP
jgi:cold shock CspA family protein